MAERRDRGNGKGSAQARFRDPRRLQFLSSETEAMSASPRSGFVLLTGWDDDGFGHSPFPVAVSADTKRKANRCASMVRHRPCHHLAKGGGKDRIQEHRFPYARHEIPRLGTTKCRSLAVQSPSIVRWRRGVQIPPTEPKRNRDILRGADTPQPSGGDVARPADTLRVSLWSPVLR